MSSTNEDQVRRLAGELFDQSVVPLAEARKAAGKQAYFPLAGRRGAASYYEPPLQSRMDSGDFAFPGAGTSDGLIEALCAKWSSEGETALAAMAPALKKLATLLADEAAEGDGSVSILCYTMF